MATGIPQKKISVILNEVQLYYKDKSSAADILNGQHAEFECVYSSQSNNRLYFGDNLDALRMLVKDSSLRNKIALIYIDPPFATKSKFLSRDQSHAYEDTLHGAQFIEFLRKRIVLLHELLSDNGSIYLHLDEKMIFEMKLVMDEVFGNNNYRNLIVRKKCNPKNYTRKTYGNIADFILFYTKTDDYIWNKQTLPLSESSKKEYQYIEEETGRRFMKVPLHAPGSRNGETGKPWRGQLPPMGKHWQYPPHVLDEMDMRGEIYWSKNGNPRRKIYLDEHAGVGVQDIWLEFRDAHNQNIKITGYPTEKNPDLLRRIIAASSNPGDIVLDCFAGSGTTLAVAHEMQRQWIGVDNSPEALRTILQRLELGLQSMGDFVTVPTVSSDDNIIQKTFFDLLESPNEVDILPAPILKNIKHMPVRDFSLFTSQIIPEDLHEKLKTRQSRCDRPDMPAYPTDQRNL